MSKVNSFLSLRLKGATDKLTKMRSLAEKSASGDLSSFAGVFGKTRLSDQETLAIQEILKEYGDQSQTSDDDLVSLLKITSEVKAINNQAVILHGERIKLAQTILKNYRDGAFSSWLMAAYGNRQTPYNFLQYYEFYMAVNGELHDTLDCMPRQAVYALASRDGDLDQKEEIVRNYQGESKKEILMIIRERFPLAKEDKRASDQTIVFMEVLKRLSQQVQKNTIIFSDSQAKEVNKLLKEIQTSIKQVRNIDV